MRGTSSRRRIRRLLPLVGGSLLALAAAGPIAGHSQIVTPPGADAPVVSGPISQRFAQAHCNAQSPSIVADRSGGVVQFLPAGALPCPAVTNPGEQVHPHAGS
jgi:hypothetical protein